ncbi:MAG: hypothetical protein ABI813_00225 [Bacteroidota bacterium]
MKRQFKQWEAMGRPAPPPHIVKQMTIRDYQQQYGYGILVETGTFRGDMVEAQKRNFKSVISIELDMQLFKKAKHTFRKDLNVKILQGDSGKVLLPVAQQLSEPAIFWLDGHYSSGVTAKGSTECPIFDELDCIFNAAPMEHVLLIDDARDFNGQGDYPTIARLTNHVKNRNNKYQVRVENDIIRYTI